VHCATNEKLQIHLFAGASGSDGRNCAIVRSTFRRLVQYGVIVAVAMAVLPSFLFWRNADPDQDLRSGHGSPRAVLAPEAQHPPQLSGFPCRGIGSLVLTLFALFGQSLRHGSGSAFHRVMLVLAPATIAAGRVGLRVKWPLIPDLGALIFWLDQTPRTGSRVANASPELVSRLRIANIVTTLIMLSS
jgi:hypothetical protein